MRVELVRAWSRRHDSVTVSLADGARVEDALAASGWECDQESTGLAVFGLAATRDALLRDGDRIELLRPLQLDPKQARRVRAERRR
ncbi:MAG: RnfH family protein [Pseudoxanthomonas sp.]